MKLRLKNSSWIALLIGVRRAKAMGIKNLIVEGNSKCTLSGAKDACQALWRLADRRRFRSEEFKGVIVQS